MEPRQQRKHVPTFSRMQRSWLMLLVLGICQIPSLSGFQPTSTLLTNRLVAWKTTSRVIPAPSKKLRIDSRSSSSSRLGMGGTNGAANGATNGEVDYSKMEPKVYPQRWIQLAYLSALALLSDWICFSVAATPDTFENAFHHSASGLIDTFLFMNVASCFLVTDVVATVGLQTAVRGAAALMAVGCWLRSGLSFLVPVANAVGLSDLASHLSSSSSAGAGLVPYPLVLVGTLMVGAAQPFFQCTPPLLSAQWFASDERATSTAVALNFNQIGIATAFLVGGAMATSMSGMENYFGLISILCTLVAAGSFLQFENLPPSPPSSSELEKLVKGEKEPPFLESVQQLFATPGFTRPLAAFVCSITITNVVGAFIDEVMVRGGITDQFQIDVAGAGFELAILIGGIVIGGYVDRTKQYKTVTLACLAATVATVIPLGLTDHSIGKEPILLILALLGLGMAAGPVQPINAELAVDVTYPGDETAVESVQQIGGNLFSALLVPIAERAARTDFQLMPKVPLLESDIRGDVVVLVALTCITYGFFSFFDAPLRRTMADQEGEKASESNGASVAQAMTVESETVVDTVATSVTESAEQVLERS